METTGVFWTIWNGWRQAGERRERHGRPPPVEPAPHDQAREGEPADRAVQRLALRAEWLRLLAEQRLIIEQSTGLRPGPEQLIAHAAYDEWQARCNRAWQAYLQEL